MDITFTNARMECGKLIIDVPHAHIGSVMHFLRSKKDKPYQLSIKQQTRKRSLDANAYAWVLINKLADVMRIPPNEVYRQAIQNIGGNSEILPVKEEAVEQFKKAWESHGIGWLCKDMGRSKISGYRNLMAYYGSSVYTTAQMAALIDSLTQDCLAIGIETRPQEDVDSLLGAWQ